MKSLLLFLSLVLPYFACAQILFKIQGDSIETYSYRDGDEFESSTLDESKWTIGLGWTRILFSQELAFTPDNVKLKNGIITFIADRKDSDYVVFQHEIDSAFLKKTKTSLTNNIYRTKYSVGAIVSKQKFHYGFYEIRFKVEKGKGVWPAYWFYGGNKNEEIDIFELKGEKNDQIHVDTHCPYGCAKGYKNKLGMNSSWGGWLKVSDYLHEGFNVMSLDWQPDQLIWYINGYPLAWFKGSFANPMNLYLNTSVAKTGEAFSPGPDVTTTWPNHFDVDYFRAWTPVANDQPVNLSRSGDFNISHKYPDTYYIKPKKKRGLLYHKKLNQVNGFISITLSGNSLTVLPLGYIRETKSTIILKSEKSEYVINDLSRESIISIGPEEREMDIKIISDKRQLGRKLLLR